MTDVPKLGDRVNIGGSVGKITELNTKYVKVEGSHRYPKMGEFVRDYDDWVVRFDPEQFNNKWSVIDMNWNLSKARIKCNY